MAAFGYAVAVGVAGNLAFHFVQTQAPIPAVLTAPSEPSRTGQAPSGTPAAAAIVAPQPAAAPGPGPAPPQRAPAFRLPPPPGPEPALSGRAAVPGLEAAAAAERCRAERGGVEAG